MKIGANVWKYLGHFHIYLTLLFLSPSSYLQYHLTLSISNTIYCVVTNKKTAPPILVLHLTFLAQFISCLFNYYLFFNIFAPAFATSPSSEGIPPLAPIAPIILLSSTIGTPPSIGNAPGTPNKFNLFPFKI